MSDKRKPVNVDGAILTSTALKEIASLQECDSCFIEQRIKELTDMAFWFVNYISSNPDETALINKFMCLIGEERSTLMLLKTTKKEAQ